MLGHCFNDKGTFAAYASIWTNTSVAELNLIDTNWFVNVKNIAAAMTLTRHFRAPRFQYHEFDLIGNSLLPFGVFIELLIEHILFFKCRFMNDNFTCSIIHAYGCTVDELEHCQQHSSFSLVWRERERKRDGSNSSAFHHLRNMQLWNEPNSIVTCFAASSMHT